MKTIDNVYRGAVISTLCRFEISLDSTMRVYRGAVISTLYRFPRYQRVLIDLSYPLWEIKKETTEMKTILLSVVFLICIFVPFRILCMAESIIKRLNL